MTDYKMIIAENLKSLRAKRKLSLDKTAKLTGISKSMIAQIEKGDVSPSVATMWKLANGFKISFSELMTTSEKNVEIVRKQDIAPLVDDESRFRNYPIIHFDPNKRFETYLMEFDAGGKVEAEPHPEGTQEYITVISGQLKIKVAGESYTIKKGETIRFFANSEHSYENTGEEMCEFHMIIYYPEIK